MQEGAPGQNQPGQAPTGAAPGPAPDPAPGGPAPDFDSSGGGLNVRLIVTLIVGIVVLLAAAVGAYALLGLGGNAEPEVTETAEEGPVTVGTPTPTATSALDPGQQVATLAPADGSEGSGEAARTANPKQFILAVSADLPTPPSGSFYEVHLTRPEPLAQFLAGRLYQAGDRWVMTLDQARDASPYSQVTVTLETVDDGNPEQVVLTGQF